MTDSQSKSSQQSARSQGANSGRRQDAKKNAVKGNRGRNYSGLSQAQRKAIRKQQFLEAGVELFGTVGFRAVTVRAICKEAKLTDRYFYEAFGSLEKLAMAVYEQCMTGLIKQVLTAMTQGYEEQDVLYAIEHGLDTYFQVLEEPRIARICMIELEGISPEVDQLYNNYIQNIARVFIGLAAKAFPDWSINEGERHVIAISLIGVLRQTATTWLLDNYDKDRQALVAGTLKVFVGTVNMISNS